MSIKITSNPFAFAASAFALMAAGVASAPADAQTRSERVAERRAAVEQRLQSMSQDRAERVAHRTTALETLAHTTPDMVEARLTEAEMQIIEALVAIDEDFVAGGLNNAGVKAEAFLTETDLQRLTDEQVDELVAAAARAATITAEDVEALIVDGILAVDDLFDTTDPDAIAATLNAIGAEALDVQVEAQELRAVLEQSAPGALTPSQE